LSATVSTSALRHQFAFWRPEYALAPPMFATRLVYLAVLVLLPPLLLERGMAPAAIGLVVGVYGYAAVAMDLLAGALADRFSASRLAAAGSAGVTGAVLLLLAAPTAALVGAARLLHGIAMGLFRPSVAALLLARVPAERRAAALGTNNLAAMGGTSLGPLAAGLLRDALGLGWALAALAALSAVSAAYVLAVFGHTERAVQAGVARPGVRSGLAGIPQTSAERPGVLPGLAGMPRLVRERRLATPLLLVLADLTILHAWLVYLPLWLIQERGYSLAAAGALISLEALCYALAQPLWGRYLDRHPGLAPIGVSLLAHGALIAALPLAGQRWELLLPLLVACGTLNAGVYPGAAALAAARVQDHERGRAMGLVSAASDAGQVLGPMAAGAAYALTARFEAALGLGLGVALVGLAAAWATDRPRRQAR
jgi:MFS family permease